MADRKGPRYKVDRELGRGAFGVVYLARDNLLRRDVALKMMTVPEGLSPEERDHQVERFYREARAAAGLSHPHVVIIHDISRSGERHFISMEYLEGTTLAELISGGPLPLDRALEIADQALGALAYAHSREVVHRDIKPDNIFVMPGDRVKLVDFGLARVQAGTTITRTGAVMGSPGYIAPEVVEGIQADSRTDVFSFGVVLYEMLTGTRPFGPHTPFESLVHVIYRIVSEDPEPVSSVNGSLPSWLDDVLAKALAKTPDDRYRHAGEFRNALRLASGKPSAPERDTEAGADVHETPGTRTADLSAGATVIDGDEGADGARVLRFDSGIEGLEGESPASGLKKSGRRLLWLWVTGAVVLLAAVVVLALFLAGVLGGGASTGEVPNLINVEETAAVAMIRKAGLKPGTRTPGFSPEISKGRIMRQFPESGKDVSKGTTIDYWVSLGYDVVAVPDVIGNTEAQAVQAVRSYGLKPNVTKAYIPGVAPGTVGETSPAPGTLVAKNDKVTIVMGTEQPPDYVPPETTGPRLPRSSATGGDGQSTRP